MFNVIAHALFALAPELDAAKVEDVPMSLKSLRNLEEWNVWNVAAVLMYVLQRDRLHSPSAQ